MPTDLSTHAIVSGLHTQIVGCTVAFFQSIESTQDEAQAAALDDEPEGCVFIADEQSKGRGQHGRHWEAPPGTGLLLSVMLRPSVEVYPQLVMVASLAAVQAIADVTGLQPALKWPNDVLVNGRKAGGILVEGEFLGDAPRYVAVGIGLNVNWDDIALPDAPYAPTSLSREAGHPIPRTQLAIALLNHLDALYLAAQRGEPLLDAWRAKLSTLGKHVRLMAGSRTIEGVAEDVTADGALVLRLPDGSTEAHLMGEITLQGG